MKAKELMIGDWVISNKRRKNEIVQVVSIDGGTNCCWLDADCYSGVVSYKDIKPIPLTAEIWGGRMGLMLATIRFGNITVGVISLLLILKLVRHVFTRHMATSRVALRLSPFRQILFAMFMSSSTHCAYSDLLNWQTTLTHRTHETLHSQKEKRQPSCSH